MTETTGLTDGGDPALDGRGFRRALGQFSTGVTIVTAAVDNELVGVTANSFSSLSLDPPLIMWAVARSSRSLKILMSASHFTVNVLAADQIPLSATFARSGDDKFVGVDWHPGCGGAPVLANVAASFECRREAEHDGGDHIIMVGRVERYQRCERDPLLYTQGRYGLAIEHPAMRDALQTANDQPVGMADRDGLVPLLFRAYRQVSSAFEEHRKQEGLNLNQSLVLAILDDLQESTLENLAALSLIGLQDTDDAITALRELHLIEVMNAGTLRLTPQGQLQRQALVNRSRLLEAELVKDLVATEVSTARRILAALAN